MKRLLFLLAGLLCCAAAGAQDIILLRNADEVKATVTEITDSHILYKVWGGSDAVLSIPRAEVFSVTYQNGEKEFFMEDRTVGKQLLRRIIRGPRSRAVTDLARCLTKTVCGDW